MNHDLLETSANTSIWMTTFADLLTLVLTFFVMKFAMIAPNSRLVAIAQSSITQDSVAPSVANPNEISQSAKNPSALAQTVRSELIRTSGAETLVNVKDLGNGVLVVFDSSSFPGGVTELSFQAMEMIRNLAAIVQARSLSVELSAYVDPRKTGDSVAPWTLSRAQALEVMRQMIDAGVGPQFISASSYAINNAVSGAPIRSALHRNGRVEIFLTPDSFELGVNMPKDSRNEIVVD